MVETLDPAERWEVDEDDRDGMEWNRHIVIEGAPHLRIAFMSHSDGAHPDLDAARARLAAAAPKLLAALNGLIEDAQPENWDDEDDPAQASAWRAAFVAFCEATGAPVPAYLRNGVSA